MTGFSLYIHTSLVGDVIIGEQCTMMSLIYTMSLVNDDVTVVLPGLGGLQTSQQSTLGGGLFNKGLGQPGGLGTGLSKSGNDQIYLLHTTLAIFTPHVHAGRGFKQSALSVCLSVFQFVSTVNLFFCTP